MKYSDLRELGDLNQYSLVDLKAKIKSLNYSELKDTDFIYACWTDKYTTLKVAYKYDNSFVKIVNQRVKIPKWTILIDYLIELFSKSKRAILKKN